MTKNTSEAKLYHFLMEKVKKTKRKSRKTSKKNPKRIRHSLRRVSNKKP
jgi:hypothetical protein